jgi:hypothetical protein
MKVPCRNIIWRNNFQSLIAFIIHAWVAPLKVSPIAMLALPIILLLLRDTYSRTAVTGEVYCICHDMPNVYNYPKDRWTNKRC